MKVKCINNVCQEDCVTEGKIYDDAIVADEYYYFTNDNGYKDKLYKHRFEVIEDNNFKPVNDKIEQHKVICQELTKIYDQKNSDYGDSFGKGFKEYDMVMPCIRLEDKLSRLKALTVQHKEQKVNDESVIDTLYDLANYAIMTIIEIKENENIQDK